MFKFGGRVEGVEGLLQQFLEPEVAAKKMDRERVSDNSIMAIDKQVKTTCSYNLQNSQVVFKS